MGFEKMMGIEPLESQKGFLNRVWTVISSQSDDNQRLSAQNA